MSWTVSFVNAAAEGELNGLPKDMRAKFARIVFMVREGGVLAMREPYAKHLTGRLWEMRLSGRNGIARSIYMTASGQRIIVLRSFVKKTQKTPPRELAIALARLKEVKE